jgi:cellulose synthase operon protein C
VLTLRPVKRAAVVFLLFAVASCGAGCSREEARRKAAGNVLFKTGDYDGAIREYRAAIVAAPKDPNSQTLLGNALFEKESWDEAKAAYQAALALDPQARAALQGLAMLHLRQKNNTEARAAFEKMVAANARDSEAHAALGKLYYADKQLDQAEQHLRQALTWAQNDTSSMYTLGLVLAKKKELAQANVVFDRLEAATAGKAYAPYGRAVAAAIAGKTDDALTQLQIALDRGIDDLAQVESDEGLASLKGLPRFTEMMAAARAKQPAKK